jgi:hypothetical protein
MKFATMKPVAILGSGPAALAAAHAVGLRGLPVAVISMGERSRLGGAQFLHRALPEVCTEEPEFTITYRVHGDEAGYRKKVYGDQPAPFVSFKNVHDGQEEGVWSLQRAYDQMLEGFQENIAGNATEAINGHWFEQRQDDFLLVINSIPRFHLCLDMSHQFTSQAIYINTDPPTWIPDNEIVYNGDPSPAWYRASRINGAGGIEYSDQVQRPPGSDLMYVTKPIANNCTCHAGVVHVGRFGKWQKGILVHEAFVDAWKACDALL